MKLLLRYFCKKKNYKYITMSNKNTFIKWLSESGLDKVSENLDKKFNMRMDEIKQDKPKTYQKIVKEIFRKEK